MRSVPEAVAVGFDLDPVGRTQFGRHAIRRHEKSAVTVLIYNSPSA